MTRCFF